MKTKILILAALLTIVFSGEAIANPKRQPPRRERTTSGQRLCRNTMLGNNWSSQTCSRHGIGRVADEIKESFSRSQGFKNAEEFEDAMFLTEYSRRRFRR